jgi:hypothetical protein
MSKKIILALALSLVLFSGTVYTAQADCGCLPHINLCSSPCNWFSCGTACRDKDLPDYNPYPERVHAITFGCCGQEEMK